MARGLYHPDDCESERTVIISELEGGENDPSSFSRSRSRPPPSRLTRTTIRPSAGCPISGGSRGRALRLLPAPLRANNATLVVVGDVKQADVLAASTITRLDPAGRDRSDGQDAGAGAGGGAACEGRQGGHCGVPQDRQPRAASSDPDFYRMLILDAVLAGAKGLNLWSSFRTPPPQRSAGCTARWSTGGWPRRWPAPCFRRAIRSSTCFR